MQAEAPVCTPHKVLKGQKALVTGANSGIGLGVAISLAQAGADVVINYVRGETQPVIDKLKEVAPEGRFFAHQADVSNEQEVEEMFNKVVAEWGSIEILINNAGMQMDAPFTEMTIDQWNKVIAVNLTGQFLCAREACRHFIRQGVRPEISAAAGKIVCMSSVHEIIPWAGHANYAASKGGIQMMMKSISQELAPQRIRINSICPGAIKTPINKEAWETPEAANKLLELIPYKRIGDVEDIGRAAVYLASDDSDYINGTSIYVDGGMTLYPGFTTNG